MSPPNTNHWGESLDRPAPVTGPCGERVAAAMVSQVEYNSKIHIVLKQTMKDLISFL